MWETFSDNCITVNDQGQKKHHPLSRGKIVGEHLGSIVDYVAGDATEAYEGRVNRFVRHVFFVKPDCIIMIDDLEAPEPSTFQYYLHSNETFQIKSQHEIITQNGSSSVRIAFATPANLQVEQESGCTPPSVGFDKEQWHLCAETKEETKKSTFVAFYKAFHKDRRPRQVISYAVKGNKEIHGIADESTKTGVIINPDSADFALGFIQSDASLLLIIEKVYPEEEVHILCVDATRLQVVEKEVYKSDKRGIYFASWDEIREELETIEPE